MAITLLDPVPAGNAMRVFITPPPGCARWRVLRRTSDAFTGWDDAGAVLVLDGDDNTVLDTKALVNGTPFFYRAYFLVGAVWIGTPTVEGTPVASYQGHGPDPVALLRERIELGFAVEVARGNVQPQSGEIKVYRGPFQRADNIQFPLAFVHQDSVAPADRFLGEYITGLDLLDDGTLLDSEGYLARHAINLGIVSRNLDERDELRRALTRVLLANLPVFGAAGIVLPEWTLTDSEDLEAQGAPLFMSGGQFTCIAPAFVGRGLPRIADVPVTGTTPSLEPSYG